MPIYTTTDGRRFDLNDSLAEQFEREVSDATIEMYVDGRVADVPLSRKADFLAKYPDATTSYQQPSKVIKTAEFTSTPTASHAPKDFLDADLRDPAQVEQKLSEEREAEFKRDINRFGVDNIPSTQQPQQPAPVEQPQKTDEFGAPVGTTHTPTSSHAPLESFIDEDLRKLAYQQEQADMSATREQVRELGQNVKEKLQQSQPQDFIWGGFGSDPTPQMAVRAAKMEMTPTTQENRAYVAANNALRNAQRIIDEADRNGADGSGNETSFVGGALRGFGQKVFDPTTWDMGLTEMGDAKVLLDALEIADNGGELTEAQQTLLDAKAVEMATNAYFGSYLGYGYKAGQVSAESIPFMLEMAINPAAALGKGASAKLTRYALKRYGKEAIKKNAAKYLATKAATRVGADVVGAATMTATTGALGTTADALRRMSGDIEYDLDENGRPIYGGHTEGDDALRAWYEAITAGAIERASEMAGGYIAPIGKYTGLSKLGGDVVRKITPKGVLKSIDNMSYNDAVQFITNLERKAQWNGVVGEFGEEIYGGVLNSILVGDQTLDAGEKGVFNRENLIETFLGVGLMGGFFSTVKTGAYAVEYPRAKRLLKRADVDAINAFGSADLWGTVKEQLASTDALTRGKAVRDILADAKLTPEQKQTAVAYVGELQRMDGVRIGLLKHQIDAATPAEEVEVEQSFENGYTLQTPQEKNDAMTMLEERANAVRRLYALPEDTDVDEFLGENPLASLLESKKLGQDDSANQIVLNYLNAKSTVDGMFQAVRDDIDGKIAQSDAQVDSRISKTDGLIHPATMKQGDRAVYIMSGDVVLLDDDTIDIANSSESIIVKDAETGKMEFSDPASLLNVGEVADAEQTKEALREQIRQSVAGQAEAEILGTLAFAQGDTYVLTDEEGAQHQAQIVADNGDGTVQVALDGATEAVQMPKDQVQAMNDATNRGRAAAYIEQQNAQRESAMQEVAEEQQPIEEQPIEQPQVEESALSRIPTDEDGNQLFEQAPAQDTWSALVELNEGDTTEATDTAQQMLDNAKKELDKATSVKPKGGATVAEIQQDKAERKARIAEAQQKVDYWTEVLNAQQAVQEQAAQEVAQAEEVAPIVEETQGEEVTEQTQEVVEQTQPATEQEEQKQRKQQRVRIKVKKDEEARRKPLRKRAQAWAKKVGVEAVIIERFEDVENESARKAIQMHEEQKSGQRIPGWYSGGKVYIYLPHATDIADLDQTYIHEVVAHHGMKKMLGEEGYNQFCLKVWDMMEQTLTERELNRWLAYPGVKGDKAKAADEYIAHLAETTESLTELDQSVWDKIVELIRDALRQLGVSLEGDAVAFDPSVEFTNKLIVDALHASKHNLKQSAKTATTKEKTKKATPKAQEDVRFRFIGEQGAANLDKAEEATTRLDNLAVARQMEEEQKDAKTIKMATGWERGADGKWRYEVNDFKLVSPEKWVPHFYGSLTLEEVMEDPNGLFEEYPELKSVKIKKDKRKSIGGTYDVTKKIITLNLDRIMDAIAVLYNPSAYRMTKEAAQELYSSVSSTLHGILIHEVQHAIQRIEGFAIGAHWKTAVNNEKSKELNERLEATNEDAKKYNALSLEEKRTDYGRELRDRILQERKTIKRLMKAQQLGADKYNRVAGEVEARNADRRRNMSMDERRASLASETADVAREDQIFIYDALADNTSFRTTYHGTPATFERFDHSFMGSGEGNQAFGWGTYVTEEKGIGEWYAKVLTDPINEFSPERRAIIDAQIELDKAERFAENLREEIQSANDNIAFFEERIRNGATGYELEEAQENIENSKENISYNEQALTNAEAKIESARAAVAQAQEVYERARVRGNVYQVEIPDDNGHNYLSWEGRLTPKQMQMIASQAEKEGLTDLFYRDEDSGELVFNGSMTSGEFEYKDLERSLGSDKAASEFLSRAGFTGIKYFGDGGNQDVHNYVIFNDADLEIKERTSFRTAPTFLSNAAVALEGIKQEKATPQQWLAMLKKAGGIKAGEDKWIGLSEWLEQSEAKTLTKQEVADFINENQIQIEETTYSSNSAVETTPEFKVLQEEFKQIAKVYEDEVRRNLDEYEAKLAKKYNLPENYFDTTVLNSDESKAHSSLSRITAEEIYNAAWVDMVDRYGDDFEIAFWRGYDGIRVDNAEAARILLGLPIDRPIYHLREDYTTKGLEGNREIALTIPTIESWNETDEIHFGDAGEGRAIAWIRFGETTDSDGKRVLVIDEIQSKRHQEGREKGYKTKKDELNIEDDGEVLIATYNGRKYFFARGTSYETIASSLGYEASLTGKDGIPSAPFEKNWAELAMKRMLRYAAEHGFDKVAWTKGDQQAERYSIGGVISKIGKNESNNIDEQNFEVGLAGAESMLYLTTDNDGKIIHSLASEYVGRTLSEVFGKELAVKMLNAKENTAIEGEGLRIGGEGMRAFYDQMLPSFMRKYAKKWGATVQDVTLPNVEEAGRTMHSVDVTDSMRESVMQGQTMFRVADAKKLFKELEERYEKLDKSDTEALNKWRDEKAAAIQSVLTAISDELGFEPPIMVFNGGIDTQEIADYIVSTYKDDVGIDFDKDWVKSYIEKSTARGLYWPQAGFITSDVSNYDESNDVFTVSATLMHENTHHLVGIHFDKRDLEAVWDEAVNANHPLALLVENLYKGESNAEKGNELLAFAIGNITKNFRNDLFNYIKGRTISEENLLDKSEYSLPLGRFALSEILNIYRNDLRRSKTEVGRSDRSTYRRDSRVDRLLQGRGRIRRKAVKEAAELFASQLNTPINIVERISDITDPNPRLQSRKRAANGWYDAATKQVVVVLPNAVSVEDVRATIFHEVVGHKGLRETVGEKRYNAFLEKVYRGASPAIRERIARRAATLGWDFNLATDEYLASLAEQGFEERENRNFFEVVRDLFLDLLSNAKIALGYRINDNDIRYMLWRTYQMQRSKGAMGIAEDMVMQQKLGVGNFAPNDTQFRVASDAPITYDNFYESTEAVFTQVERPDRPADYVSYPQGPGVVYQYDESGKITGPISSEYWYGSDEGGDYVVRGSDHWTDQGETVDGVLQRMDEYILDQSKPAWKVRKYGYLKRNYIASCDWSIVGPDVPRGAKLYGKAYLSDMSWRGSRAKQLRESSQQTSFRETTSPSDDVRMRVAHTPYRETLIRQQYEERIKSGMYQSMEAMQDSMQSLHDTMLMILKEEGYGDMYIEDVASFENAYIGENRLSSTNLAEANAFANTVFQRLVDAIAAIAPNEEARTELIDYMFAKHGLERNEKMAERDAKREYDQQESRIAAKAISASGTKTMAELIAEKRQKDYAGLTALTGKKQVSDAEKEAQRMVEEYENSHETAEIWERVQEVRKAILSKLYEGGLMSKEQMEQILDMYDYYIPLRGFDEKTVTDQYAYLTSTGGSFSSPIRKAGGRESKADDPFANLSAMAESAILQANRNMLVKQRFLNFVLRHPSDLVSVNRLWLRYDETNQEWVPEMPNILETDSPDEVARKVAEHEQAMKELSKAYPDRYKVSGDQTSMPYKVPSKETLKEHQVIVKRNGVDYVLTINGSPRLAQALNGLTNPDNDISGAIGAVLDAAQWVNRALSAAYTTRNPDFLLSNFMRDMLYTNTMVWVKESPNYALAFHKNYLRANPAQMKILYSKYNEGTLDMSDPMEAMFYKFIINGGETGYVNLKDVEQHKSELKEKLARSGGKLSVKEGLQILGDRLDGVNQAVENCARFAAFMTSQQMGRSVDRSIYDAKEISVNFNKKGAGSKFMGANGQTALGNTAAFTSGLGRAMYVFWNAAIQGTANFGRQAKRHPAKAFTAVASWFVLGALMAYLGYDDDDEDAKNSYFNNPEYVRRSNIMFHLGNGNYAKIPLPIEARAAYGLGELMVSVMSGKEDYSDGELASAIVGQMTQILPIDFMEGQGGFHAFIPSSVKPVTEIVSNTSWTGLPIYKDTPYNKDMPNWTKAYSSTNKYLVNLAATLNELSGGDKYTKGAIDLNPANIEYLLNGYFGGYFATADKLTKTAEMVVGARDFDPRGVLFLNRVLAKSDDRTQYRAVNNKYYEAKKEYETTKRRLRNYEHDTDEGIFNFAEKIDFLYNSEAYRRMELFDIYRGDIEDLEREIKDATSDEEKEALNAELMTLKSLTVDAIYGTEEEDNNESR